MWLSQNSVARGLYKLEKLGHHGQQPTSLKEDRAIRNLGKQEKKKGGRRMGRWVLGPTCLYDYAGHTDTGGGQKGSRRMCTVRT